MALRWAIPKPMLQDYGLFCRHGFRTTSGTNGRRSTSPSRPSAFGAGAEVFATFGKIRLGAKIKSIQSPKSDYSNLVAILGRSGRFRGDFPGSQNRQDLDIGTCLESPGIGCTLAPSRHRNDDRLSPLAGHTSLLRAFSAWNFAHPARPNRPGPSRRPRCRVDDFAAAFGPVSFFRYQLRPSVA